MLLSATLVLAVIGSALAFKEKTGNTLTFTSVANPFILKKELTQ